MKSTRAHLPCLTLVASILAVGISLSISTPEAAFADRTSSAQPTKPAETTPERTAPSRFDLGVTSPGQTSTVSNSNGGQGDRVTLDVCGRTPEEVGRLTRQTIITEISKSENSSTYLTTCPVKFLGNFAIDLPRFLFGGPPPPPDPAVLAQQAVDSIEFPTPEPHLGPETQLAVNRWIYLTVDNPGTLTAQAAVPGLAITATATLTTTTWSMGEITDLDTHHTVAPITCEGAGVAPTPNANLRASKPQEPGTCAYAYQYRSLPERTGGTGTWPVTATTTWSITWTATDGTTGTATRTQTSDPTPASIGEWASELVPVPGS